MTPKGSRPVALGAYVCISLLFQILQLNEVELVQVYCLFDLS